MVDLPAVVTKNVPQDRRRRAQIRRMGYRCGQILVVVGLAACTPPAPKPVFQPDIGMKAQPAAVQGSPAKVVCDPLGTVVLDPIGGATHLHEWFGGRDLFGGIGTSCGNPADTAHYWVPALVYVATGQPVPVRNFFAYYRAFDHANVGDGDPYPQGARLVAGSKDNVEPLDVRQFNWSCDQRSTRPGPYGDIPSAHCDQATGTVYLTAHIDFPTCWNGQLTGTNDTPNFAYYPCPPGFPFHTVELRETVKWYYRGDGSDVALSSDLMAGAVAGRTLHGDFWNTWDQDGFAEFVHNCVNQRC